MKLKKNLDKEKEKKKKLSLNLKDIKYRKL